MMSEIALDSVDLVENPTGISTANPGDDSSHALQPDQSDRNDAGVLLARMRAGDREAASRFMQQFGEILRRRVRGKMGRGMRRLFDSQEILSTVSRRLDRYVRDGQVRAGDEPQLWSLVFKMADAALIDKVRMYKRLQTVEGEDSDFAERALDRIRTSEQRVPEGAELELDAAFKCLKGDVDRELLAMWLNGLPFAQIAAMLDTTPAGARQRWQAIRAQLRSHWLLEGEK